MRKIHLYIACSLDGKIATADGSVDWLEQIPNPEGTDYGYHEFYAAMDTTLMGFKTYEQIANMNIPFPYTSSINYVFSRKEELTDTEHVKFVKEDIGPFCEKLKTESGGDIWLVGGGMLNAGLLEAGLIDELRVFIMPIVLGAGVSLFGDSPIQKALHLTNAESYESGVLMLQYQVVNEAVQTESASA